MVSTLVVRGEAQYRFESPRQTRSDGREDKRRERRVFVMTGWNAGPAVPAILPAPPWRRLHQASLFSTSLAPRSAGTAARAKSEARRGGDVAFQHRLDLAEGVIVVSGRVRHDAVRWGEDLVFAHVRVVGREQHTDIARDACEDHPPDAERLEQGIQGGVEDPECLGFKTK